MGVSKKRVIGCAVAIAVSSATLLQVRGDSTASTMPAGTVHKTAQDAKAAALARTAARKAVHDAVAALAKEYEAHVKDSTAPLREKSTYFKDNPSSDVTPNAILYALHQSDGPTAEACYIKWQLLSGLPPKADEKLTPKIGDLYADAPAPFGNPSVTASEKQQLDSQTMRMTQDQESTVNDAWNKHLAEWADINLPILNYRDALFDMLPEGLGATTLGLQDAFQVRAAAGVASDVFGTNVLTQARDFAVSATPEQLGGIDAQCARWTGVYDKTFPPLIYLSVLWDEKSRSLKWQPKPVPSITLDALKTFRKFLTDQASPAGGGIKIKAAS